MKERATHAPLEVFVPRPSRPPPRGTTGALGWMRENLFYSWSSTLFTFAASWLVIYFALDFYAWSIGDAVWVAENRRECLDRSPGGACWAGIRFWYEAFLYGRYPSAERWRIDLALLLLIVWLVPLWLPRVTERVHIGISAACVYPFLGGYLFAGGERGMVLTVAVPASIAVIAVIWVHVASCMLTGSGVPARLVHLAGLRQRHQSTWKYPLLALLALATAVAAIAIADWQPPEVKSNRWGGLALTFLIAYCGIVVALPGGVVLALGRRCSLLFIRSLVITYIELVRSVPLITVLFMAVTMTPIFLPQGIEMNKLALALVAICGFASAYMAEVVRGGIQAIPAGQVEAARSIGLTSVQVMRLVVLPQALRIQVPNIVSSFIGLLKDTTVVALIGLYDFLSMLRASGNNSVWIGLFREPLIIGAAVYFVLCYSMSRYSRHLERSKARRG